MEDLTKLKKIYEEYASLKISFEVFEHNVQSFMKFSKSKTDTEKKTTIDYSQLGNVPSFQVSVPSFVIVGVLERFLKNPTIRKID